jgi:NtrC-family two-component system sensor histidine kinase KinB
MTPFFCRLATDRQDKKTEPVSVAVRALQIKNGNKISGAVVELREVKRVLNVGEMKSLFVSFAAHQLKTPSSIVKGFLELMMREGKEAYQPQQWHNLQSAFEANENLISLSKTLLNLTRLEGGLIEPKIAPFNPHAVLQNKIKTHHLLLKVRGIKAEIPQPKQPVSFHSDEVFFSEICDILLSNALKHAPVESTITITCTVNNNELRAEVRDQGPGVPKERQATLFNSAVASDPDHNAHGLGLLMARKYVSLLGGSIGLVPGTRQGAAFYFIIPRPAL